MDSRDDPLKDPPIRPPVGAARAFWRGVNMMEKRNMAATRVDRAFWGVKLCVMACRRWCHVSIRRGWGP